MKYTIGPKALLACLCFALLAVPAAASTYYLPQVAVGTAGDLQIRTLLTISNPQTGDGSGSKNITVALATYHDDGSAWVVDWEARDRPDLSGPRSDFSVSLVAGASVTLLAKSTGAVETGWMGGRSNFPAVLTLRYSVARVNGGAVDPQWEVGVLPAAGLNEQFLSVAEGASDWNGCTTSTAIAVANTAEEAATLTLELFPYAGITPARTRTIPLASHGHLAQFLPEIFTDIFSGAAFRGMLRISSNTAIAVTTLQNWVTGSDSVYSSASALPFQDAATNLTFDQEPSDTPGAGEYIRPPAQVVGVLSSASDGPDTDYFRIYAERANPLIVVSLAEATGATLAPNIALLAQDGQTELMAGVSLLPGFGMSAFQVPIPEVGWYWLRVSSPTSAHGRRLFYRIFVGLK
jgi:hypothetical protein